MNTIEDIKGECRQIIKLGEQATQGPWNNVESEGDYFGETLIGLDSKYEGWQSDVNFIAASRSFTPRAAKALLDAITILERIAKPALGGKQQQASAQNQLAAIRRDWEESK